jgi:ACR3 family arsenite efflux pump ArsB
MNVISTIFMPIFIVLGSLYGVNGLAIGLSIYMFLMIYPSWKLFIQKMIAVSFKEYKTVFKWNLPYLISLFKNNLLKR